MEEEREEIARATVRRECARSVLSRDFSLFVREYRISVQDDCSVARAEVKQQAKEKETNGEERHGKVPSVIDIEWRSLPRGRAVLFRKARNSLVQKKPS